MFPIELILYFQITQKEKMPFALFAITHLINSIFFALETY